MTDRLLLPPPRYSVVVTAHNERRGVGPCLLALSRQAGVQAGDFEAVFVDDRSTDGTAEVVASLGLPFVRIFAVSEDPPPALTSRQRALDLAFGEARAPVILTLDADSLVPDDWLRGMTARLDAGTADAVVGLVAFKSDAGVIGDCQSVDAAFYFAVCAVLSKLRLDGGAFFGNFAFRRDLYGRVGGFQRVGFALTEDLAFTRALRADGCGIAYQFSPVATVRACDTWLELVERAKRVGSGPASWLSVTLGVWMLALPALAAIGLMIPTATLAWLFALRYMAGVAIVAATILMAGRRRRLHYALVYEPLAICLGFFAMLGVWRNRTIAWGGKRYDRR